MSKPILCVDFDGVIHSYTSGWVEHDFIPDPPVSGAIQFLFEAVKHFDVKIYSSRSNSKYENGIRAMKNWLYYWAKKELTNEPPDYKLISFMNEITRPETWPQEKPSAFLTIDDRALTFNGDWSNYNPKDLLTFKPWNKK